MLTGRTGVIFSLNLARVPRKFRYCNNPLPLGDINNIT